jgi:hypothetical protein
VLLEQFSNLFLLLIVKIRELCLYFFSFFHVFLALGK